MSQTVSASRRRFVPALCFAALIPWLQAGCASQGSPVETGGAAPPAAGQAAAAPAGEQQGSTPAAVDPESAEGPPEVTPVEPAPVNREVEAIEGPIPLSPPDGRWLTDEFGRKYFVTKIKKVGGAWVWVEEGKKVQLIRGLTFDVVSHDETSFDVKIYGTDASMAADIAEAVRRRATPEDLARVAATYAVSTAGSDRLRFAPFSQGLPQSGQWRNGFVVTDINEDGSLDIVHGPPRKGGSTPAIFLGDGKGRWRRWTEATFPAMAFDYGDVAVADFNRDGHPDLALASHLRGIVVVVGDGKGNFRAWSEGIDFEAGDQDRPIFSSRAITAVDWNGDGRPDVLAWGEGPRLASARPQGGGGPQFARGSRGAVIYLNQGNGTWQKKTGPESPSYGDEVVAADFNGDSKHDFAAASAVTGNRTLLYLGREDGSWNGVPSEALRPAATFRGVAAGDFNRDGRVDLAVGYSSNELGVARTGLDVLLARPDGSWERLPLQAEEKRTGVWALGAGDLDGDGALDVVGITGEGAAWVFLGDGKGGFTREQSPELEAKTDCTGYHLELVDVDGDGAAELIAGFAGEATVSPLGTPGSACNSGGSLQVWKASRQGAR